ncbi:FMN-dependent NADH-azoreductase [Mucilaginibacter sp. SP1R1]|uniref:FMN-dependent NADH-azoreductase n=1 Tax=Mucilaginibacter sp. SP1R1 TaxID=2723091 RepID=UPI001617E2EE|nr:NAD(P)H-dependent oxidoreductase [Mucilaginibacter sp. SP1R1]MBB6151447.1 FMN-dependent NADH-azoreductase [Mucilaginibacter sp. SP1R1]
MKKILHIISTPKGSGSYSLQLGNAVIEKLKNTYPGSSVKEINLLEKQIPHLQEAHIHAFFTPAGSHTAESTALISHSEEAIADVMEADILVIGAPLYNFGIPSTLKTWIDHVVRAGKTFKYDANGPEGLVKGKKVYIAMASGGIYSEGPIQAYDFVTPYLKAVLGFIGLTDVSVFRVEGTSVAELKDAALEKGINSIVLN